MNDSKNKVRFNIFDIIIILAVIASIAAVVLKVAYFDKHNDISEHVIVNFTVYDIMDNTAASASKGNVYLTNGDSLIGEIISAEVETNKIYIEEDGVAKPHDNPLGKKNLHGRIKFAGISSETGFFIDGKTKITVGSVLSVYILDPLTGNGAAVEITVNSIEKAE